MKLGAHGDRFEVDGLDEVCEEGALDAQDVPAEDLVGAGHREKSVAGPDAVPRLDENLGVDGHGAHATLDLGSQHAPGRIGRLPRSLALGRRRSLLLVALGLVSRESN